ncbi:hypothetical protein [Corynebacterium cystitidis]|uniref:Uncharacterized protein n=1 Tax=Corynebacterium cystitidis DSM 20524 TaxID=1121357 RepID=A0A1H9W716_9CORY|nr:hypothetical protein [Corynebacterium cystitidis]WJY83237.1 hypothetical protein CCYS_11735 [Corynebacterium cystitidis DSM 20524]SES29569.1 hypothetical protein SAMN05661109_02567 [Corynebacterium cystitidis DSM 20524]SNV67887.1 Uncharacterised protein [Corynebacterium cystitidis]
MHWVSWDRTDRDNPRLLAEAGPEVLAEFSSDSARVDGVRWDLAATPVSGAVARVDGVELMRSGAWKRNKEVPVVVDGRDYLMINEDGSDWIIDDARGEKVAQFSGKNHGVRMANLEFEGETDLPLTDVVALAWVSRLALENKTMGTSKALIATLVLLSIVAVLVFFI